MIRLEQDQPATGPIPDGCYRFPGCVICQVAAFDSPDQDLVDRFVRAHRP